MANTILLADDSVTIQKVVELTFMDQDYEVVATGDGTSALEQLPDLRPDLVIADVHMPGADGYEVCRQTKESHPNIPVLLLVGTFEQFDESKAASVGADGHLKKPFDSQDLLSQVETLIAQSGQAEATDAPSPAGSDVFEAADQAPVGDLEPPSLEASAAPAGDVWGAELPEVEAAPAVEPEAVAFSTSPAPEPAPSGVDYGAPLPVTDLDQDVTDTAAVDLDAVASDVAAATADSEPAAATPIEDLEAPSLEAPSIEDFAPFEDPPVAEPEPAVTVAESAAVEPAAPAVEPAVAEPVAPAVEESSYAIEPFPLMASDEAAAGEPAAEEPVAEESAAEEPVADEPVTDEPAVEEAAAEESPAVHVAEEPAAGETVAEESAAAETAAEATAASEPAAAGANGSGPLSDDDVERIARRVAELVGEKALRDVAWDVLPDLAEVIIKERIRELESQVV